ncbi:CNNM domain-containing protein [Aquibacillus koreensis]|uniref:CNNM domain-containing protein n=1 Tax=Aquibacillus koreensis TaxID=279446 RepID=A0A9X3WJU3_9BACI|nr:CNNM domain-containing protein [Aquibacillus koreensis]MCT2535752.1 CNNM domain-containing protein [Aquibacillus koreensis]MDC3420208.1 CNNM domain-containing protein [Aquibacillus koreensis]
MFIAIAFFIVMSFFLSGSETALTAVNRTKIQSKAESEDPKSQRLLKLISNPNELITAILIGNNISNIMLPTLVTIVAIDRGINVGIATGVLTVVLIIFAEVLPKSIAATFADKIAYMVAPAIRILLIITKPLTFLLSKFTNAVIRFLSKGKENEATVSKEELKTMVDIALTEGTFHHEETHHIKGAIDFYSKDVRDALKTPRIDIQGIPSDATFEVAREIVLSNNYTRYPVYKDNMDHIVGVFHSKLLLEWSINPAKQLKDFADLDPLFVSETASIEKVFKMMLKEKKHLAIVIDEYGGTTGIITNEDIIEAMIGLEIEDETDEEEDVLIDELTESHIICHGKLAIRRLNEVFKTKIPEDEDILAGFLLKEFGYIPDEEEDLEYHHLHFVIKKVEENKLTQVEITKKINQSN